MRCLFLYLLVVFFASTNASAREHHAKSRYVVVRRGQAVIPRMVAPGGARIYRDNSVPGGLRTDHDPPPYYNDPSRFGGG
jgi:hypothetical protein